MLNSKLPTGISNMSASLAGTNAYIFGGNISNMDFTNEIVKFDATTETATVLDAKLTNQSRNLCSITVGTNIYIFDGGYKISYKFDTTTETITTLSIRIPSGRNFTSAIAIDNKAYIFGGYDGTNRLDEILKVTNLS